MNPINNILSVTTIRGTICLELESFSHQTPSSSFALEDAIRYYDHFLDKLAIPRAKINELKKAKDQLVKQYVYNTKPPVPLDIALLNYKALLFYFKDTFIRSSFTLKLQNYTAHNDFTKIYQSKHNNLTAHFSNGELKIKVYYNNFPHLLGIRKPVDGQGNTIDHQYIENFLDDIFYETKVIEDFQTLHKGDAHKLEVFSWVYSTLRNPTYIVENDAIKAPHYNATLSFIKRLHGQNLKYAYHIVGLEKLPTGEFAIKSQFPIKTDQEFRKKFDVKKGIYVWKR